jgi:hypothetical protein
MKAKRSKSKKAGWWVFLYECFGEQKVAFPFDEASVRT